MQCYNIPKEQLESSTLKERASPGPLAEGPGEGLPQRRRYQAKKSRARIFAVVPSQSALVSSRTRFFHLPLRYRYQRFKRCPK